MTPKEIILDMYKVGDSLSNLKKLYRCENPQRTKVIRLHKYWETLMTYSDNCIWYEWFLGNVLYCTVDEAFSNLKAVL